MQNNIAKILILSLIALNLVSCKLDTDRAYVAYPYEETEQNTAGANEVSPYEETRQDTDGAHEAYSYEDIEASEPVGESSASPDLTYDTEFIYLDMTAKYATYSVINDGFAVLYKANPQSENYKDKVVAVNAGHGTKNGTAFKTFSHPDFTPKVSSGTNKKGDVLSTAVSAGMTFNNGMTEANANLAVAAFLKEELLADGYSVLMIRENDDCRLDNIARTVIANENADIHIAIHFDSTDSDKGIFYIVPYNEESYLDMEPVKSNAYRIIKLGNCLIEAFREKGEKIWKDKGTLQGDLTQISYSLNASVDIELGDRATDLTMERAKSLAEGLKLGIDKYFEG